MFEKIRGLWNGRGKMQFENPPLRVQHPEINTPDPIQPLRPSIFPDNNRVLATLYAETANQPEEGMQSAFDVVRNRANKRKTSWDQEISRPHQFEAFGNPMYQKALRQAQGESVFNGQDLDSYNRLRGIMERNGPSTIGDSTLYLNPNMQMAMGRQMPSWANPSKRRAVVGDHEFYSE